MSNGTARVVGLARELRCALRDFEPGLLSGGDCATVAEELALTEKACGAGRFLAARRAVDCGAHKEAGVPDPVAWVARQGGTTGADARGALELARALGAHPDTKEALLSGAVSVAQAQEITKAEAASPGQEHDLLALAKAGDLTKLRDEARERRLAATKPEDLHRDQLAARRFRHWRDALGMVRFDGALPPETGIPFVNRIERRAAQLRREKKHEGAEERFEVHAADALLECATGPENGRRGPATDLVIVCDLYAWRRGHAHPGEPCHLIGGGPIPVGLAKELSDDAFLKVALHDGVDIQKICHVGRRYTAELKTALDLGPAPSFGGRACVDCGRRWGLENDHDVPVAHTGPTSYENVKGRCYPCHQEKTERDRKAGLLKKKTQRGPPKGGGPIRGAGGASPPNRTRGNVSPDRGPP